MPAFDHVVFVYGTLTDRGRARTVLAADGRSAGSDRSDVDRDVDCGPRADGQPLDRREPGDQGAHHHPRNPHDARARPDEPFAFVEDATLSGFHRVDGAYPTLAPGGAVDGRLLAVDDDGLAALDAYEGVGRGLYVRVGIPVTHPAVDADRAWVYVGDPDRLGADATWPGGASLATRAEGLVDRTGAVVRARE